MKYNDLHNIAAKKNHFGVDCNVNAFHLIAAGKLESVKSAQLNKVLTAQCCQNNPVLAAHKQL